MESYSIELVFVASAQLFPENTFSSFTNFLPEQLNLESQWEVAVSEKSDPTMYQNFTDGKFIFLDEETFRVIWILLSGTWSSPFHYGYC